MAKLTRITQKQFGGNVPSATNNQITAFGSIKAGTPSYTLDPAAMQTSAYELGWSDAVVTGYTPYREDFNALEFINSYQLRYIFEAGIPEWDSGTTYFKGSYVKVINSSGVPTRYYSLTDSNLNNNPTTDTINWTEDAAVSTLVDLADVAISGASGGQALVYNSTTQKWENAALNVDNYGKADFIHANATSVFSNKTLVIEPCIIKLTVDGVDRLYNNTAAFDFVPESNLDTGSALQSGNNYYIYLVPNGTECALKCSLNSTYPTGYTASNTRKIGGFHTLCADVGIITDHPLSGYVASDILPASVWCLNHRPYSSPEGMVYEPTQNVWVDIYLQSGTNENTKSAYGATVTDTRQYVDHVEDMFRVNKALLNDEEFAAAMEGSNQKTNIVGNVAPNPKTAGAHKDTASRRMISNIGCEEGCGYLWQWLATTSAAGGSNWAGQSGNKGDYYGGCYALRAGGYWADSTHCGSRCRSANLSRAVADAVIGGRGRSRPRNFI